MASFKPGTPNRRVTCRSEITSIIKIRNISIIVLTRRCLMKHPTSNGGWVGSACNRWSSLWKWLHGKMDLYRRWWSTELVPLYFIYYTIKMIFKCLKWHIGALMAACLGHPLQIVLLSRYIVYPKNKIIMAQYLLFANYTHQQCSICRKMWGLTPLSSVKRVQSSNSNAQTRDNSNKIPISSRKNTTLTPAHWFREIITNRVSLLNYTILMRDSKWWRNDNDPKD